MRSQAGPTSARRLRTVGRAVHGFRALCSPVRVRVAEPAVPGEGCPVRYEGLTNIVKLAIRMQGLRGGMTLDEIET